MKSLYYSARSWAMAKPYRPVLSRIGFMFTYGLLFVSLTRDTLQGAEALTGASIYSISCAQCHGAELQGGQAQSLVDAIWQFGAGAGAMARNVKNGIPDFSMPSFEAALSEEEIRSVVSYILSREKEVGAVKPPPPAKLFSLDYEIKAEVVAEGLNLPWGIDFLDHRRALLTERSGQLRLMVDGHLIEAPIQGIPQVLAEGQGGLLDVAVDPAFDTNGWIYLSYSHGLSVVGEQRPPAMTRVVRGRLKGLQWVDQQVVFEAPHETYLETRHHYGSRLAFDPQRRLYFSIGDRGHGALAQDLSRPNGKIHRLNSDGTIPKDNPFLGQADALPSIFAYGNRNPQGLATHPVTGRIWETEHGPMGGDELNLISAGANYGWPTLSYGRDYDGSVISDHPKQAGVQAPALYWKPSIAVCGMDFVQGDLFPRWRNFLLVAALKYEELRLLDIEEDRVLHQEVLLKNAGRIRDVGCAPDGAVYVILNGPDTVLRLTPIRDLNRPDEDL